MLLVVALPPFWLMIQLSIKKQNKQLILFAKDAVCLSGPD
jgi:hypothetical protein